MFPHQYFVSCEIFAYLLDNARLNIAWSSKHTCLFTLDTRIIIPDKVITLRIRSVIYSSYKPNGAWRGRLSYILSYISQFTAIYFDSTSKTLSRANYIQTCMYVHTICTCICCNWCNCEFVMANYLFTERVRRCQIIREIYKYLNNLLWRAERKMKTFALR